MCENSLDGDRVVKERTAIRSLKGALQNKTSWRRMVRGEKGDHEELCRDKQKQGYFIVEALVKYSKISTQGLKWVGFRKLMGVKIRQID